MKTAIGVDISKAKFDVALLLNGKFKQKQFENKKPGFTAFSKWLANQASDNIHVCLEATGNYGDHFASHCFESGLVVSVVNPAQIKSFAGAQLSRNKTDQADAKIIANFCLAMSPKPWKPLKKAIKTIRLLVGRLDSLKQMLQQEKNRLSTACKVTSPFLKKIALSTVKCNDLARINSGEENLKGCFVL